MMPVIRANDKNVHVSLCKALMGYGDKTPFFDEGFASFVKDWQNKRALTADGIVGRCSWARLLKETLAIEPEEEKTATRTDPKDFKQYDPRWSGKLYSTHGDKKQTIRTSGCGPTAMADIVAVTRDETVTPPVLCEKALLWGDRTYDSGTAWRFFDHAAKEYAFCAYERSSSWDRLKSCLDEGGLAVAGMGKGYWTKGGHYICVKRIEDGYVYCNDPASSKRTRQKTGDFMKERKMFFLFWA